MGAPRRENCTNLEAWGGAPGILNADARNRSECSFRPCAHAIPLAEEKVMQGDNSSAMVNTVRDFAHVHAGSPEDYEPLMELIGSARVVLIGQASYGTHEFYAARARITRLLIEQKGFAAVAVGADWADASHVNRYVQGDGDDVDARTSLDGFRRFATSTWRNAAVIDFLEWLRAYNQSLQGDPPIGFHGLDFYNLHNANRLVSAYLDRLDPVAAHQMRCNYAYACFGDPSNEAEACGDEFGATLGPSYENELIAELVESRRRLADEIMSTAGSAEYEAFFAEQRAQLDQNAEKYYRAMVEGKVSSWTLRNRRLEETLAALVDHLERSIARGKVVFWAHNAIVGDSRAHESQPRGETSVGQLARDRYGEAAVLIGLTTYHGTVRAASEWDGPFDQKAVLPSLAGSYESLFHEVGHPRFVLSIRGNAQVNEALRGPRQQRSIGIIYRPEAEPLNNYFSTRLNDQFDAVIHFDQTTAVHPLEGDPDYEVEEMPASVPAGA
jgi:erythromycin esterase-like protein